MSLADELPEEALLIAHGALDASVQVYGPDDWEKHVDTVLDAVSPYVRAVCPVSDCWLASAARERKVAS